MLMNNYIYVQNARWNFFDTHRDRSCIGRAVITGSYLKGGCVVDFRTPTSICRRIVQHASYSTSGKYNLSIKKPAYDPC